MPRKLSSLSTCQIIYGKTIPETRDTIDGTQLSNHCLGKEISAGGWLSIVDETIRLILKELNHDLQGQHRPPVDQAQLGLINSTSAWFGADTGLHSLNDDDVGELPGQHGQEGRPNSGRTVGIVG